MKIFVQRRSKVTYYIREWIIIIIIITIIIIIIIVWIDSVLGLLMFPCLQSKVVQSFMAFREEQKKRYLDSFPSSFNVFS